MLLRSLNIIRSDQRNSAIDIFRSLAILSVVLFHFNQFLPYGHLGVDLFFVISGLLIGSILFKEWNAQGKIAYGRFLLMRGFKIWPSYYFFFIAGSLLAYSLYQETHPDQIIDAGDRSRYLFFYQNYTGFPVHFSFDHVWSLCVEEHFYVILPLMMMVAGLFRQRSGWLMAGIFSFIALGMVSKFIMYHYTNSHDTYSATHNRLDGLAWGVLLAVLLQRSSFREKTSAYGKWILLAGALLFVSVMTYQIRSANVYFEKTLLHSITPICFFLMLMGSYHMKFAYVFPLRFIAYYSYNWYLWHPIWALYCTDRWGVTSTGLFLFILLSFACAFLSTVLIEEPFLKIRDRWLKKNRT